MMRLLLVILVLSISSNISAKRKEIETKDMASVAKVFKGNEHLYYAFFKYDGQKVKKLGFALSLYIDQLQNLSMKKRLEPFSSPLKKLHAGKNRGYNDAIFSRFSRVLVSILKEYKVPGKYNGYHCPMVEKSWVQDSSIRDEVHNPYAPWMPHCGRKVTKFN